MFMNEILFV